MPRRPKHLLLCLTLGLLLGGCSAGHDFLQNRADDALDIVSAEIGFGFGVKAYAFGLQPDSGYNYGPLAGIRAGEAFVLRPHDDHFHVEEGNIGVFLPFVNADIFYPGERAVRRGKAYGGSTLLLPFFLLHKTDEVTKGLCNTCSWSLKHKWNAYAKEYKKTQPKDAPIDWTELRRAFYAEHADLPEFGGRSKLDIERPAWSVYTDIHVAAALGIGFRIGFNAGEFADFLLGWVGLDLFGDDL